MVDFYIALREIQYLLRLPNPLDHVSPAFFPSSDFIVDRRSFRFPIAIFHWKKKNKPVNSRWRCSVNEFLILSAWGFDNVAGTRREARTRSHAKHKNSKRARPIRGIRILAGEPPPKLNRVQKAHVSNLHR